MISEERAKPKARDRRQATPDQAQLTQNMPAVAPGESAPDATWRERATFLVAFDEIASAAGPSVTRTRAYHEEADSRAEWPGVAGEALLAWMRERTGLPAPTAVTDSSKELDIVLSPLEVVGVPAEQERDGRPHSMRLHVQLAFQLTSPADPLIAKQWNCSIQLLACDMISGQPTVLAARAVALQPDQLDYTMTADCDLPEIGHYQLVGMVLFPNHAMVRVTLGPLLRVTA